MRFFYKIHAAHLRLKGINVGSKCNISIMASISVHRGGKISIGNGAEIAPHVRIESFGGDIEIGHTCSINPFCMIYGHGGLTIGDDVRIAAHVTIVPANHNFADPDQPIRKQGLSRKGIRICDDVWIGTGARILDGVTLGRGCIIGAGAVVTKSTEPNGIYGGVPARLIGKRGVEEIEPALVTI